MHWFLKAANLNSRLWGWEVLIQPWRPLYRFFLFVKKYKPPQQSEHCHTIYEQRVGKFNCELQHMQHDSTVITRMIKTIKMPKVIVQYRIFVRTNYKRQHLILNLCICSNAIYIINTQKNIWVFFVRVVHVGLIVKHKAETLNFSHCSVTLVTNNISGLVTKPKYPFCLVYK